MKFPEEFFQSIAFEKSQIEQYFSNAKKDFQIAEQSKNNDVILHFAYNAAIKLGISLIAEMGYKVRSIPGHHVKILESTAQILDCRDEVDYLQTIRQRRNVDLYEGGSSLSDKEAADLLRITKSLFEKYLITKQKQNGGFTLVELIVSVGITAVLMMGLATFFSSTFRNMFMAREKVANSQEQFVVSTILDGKFVKTDEVQQIDPGGTFAVIKNDMDTGALPFTFIGKDGDKIIFKDFFVFNGRYGTNTWNSMAIDNPGGITPWNGGFLVTVPADSLIHWCPAPLSKATCTPKIAYNITDLNQPVDITSNGTDTVYVTNAGTDQILKITDIGKPTQASEVLADGLNYPTGLEYYKSGTNEYLFVSDTYNHLVKRINLSDNSIETVVGAGNDEVCHPSDGREHTALFCQLRFPTDVIVGNNGSGDALYIADTGNNRVLKVSDPAPDLSNYKLPLSLISSTQVSRVDFEIPGTGSTPKGATDNDLHPVKYSSTAPVISASLTGQTTGNVMSCTGDPCTNYFRGFYVDDANNIFQAGDTLDIGGGSYTVSNVSDEGGGSWKVVVNPPNTTIDPLAGTNVRITNTFSGDKNFYLNLSSVTFSELFNKILIKAYDEDGTLNNDPPDSVIIRMGDGVLGTSEDTISIADTVMGFPTGLSFSGPSLYISDIPEFSVNFADYDYVSDFSVQNLEFSQPNDKNLLELNFEANLGKDAEGNDLWQDYTLNADVTP